MCLSHSQDGQTGRSQLLGLNRDLLDRLETTASVGREGAAALDSWAASLVSTMSSFLTQTPESKANRLATLYQGTVYAEHPSALGPYFRVLFQVFNHIAEADLHPKEREQYANIARGQLSEGAVLLLAANGLTERGHRFIPLIERFGLLEHMHPQYLKLYRRGLEVGYRERAFLGDKEREDLPWEEVPKQLAGYFVCTLEEPIVQGGERADPSGQGSV